MSSVLSLIYYYNRTCILLTKTTAAQNGVALSYRKVRRLYFLAVVFVRLIVRLHAIYGICYIWHMRAVCLRVLSIYYMRAGLLFNIITAKRKTKATRFVTGASLFY